MDLRWPVGARRSLQDGGQRRRSQVRGCVRQAARLAGEIDGEAAEQERVRTQIADCARAATMQDCRVLRCGLDEKRALLAEAQNDLALSKAESEKTKEGFMTRRELLRGQTKGALEAEQDRLDRMPSAQKAACRDIEE